MLHFYYYLANLKCSVNLEVLITLLILSNTLIICFK